MAKPRRVYKLGPACQDCGRHVPVTLIHFWLNNMPYWVCSQCIKPYRARILAPERTHAS